MSNTMKDDEPPDATRLPRDASADDMTMPARTAAATLADIVGAQAVRKLAARRDGTRGVWFGFGTMGVVGWSIVVPTLLGAGLGRWLDARAGGVHSWTLALMMAGLCLGAFNAWLWVAKEDRAMHAGTSISDEEGGP